MPLSGQEIQGAAYDATTTPPNACTRVTRHLLAAGLAQPAGAT